MGTWKRYIPEGMKDTLFEECEMKLEIENTLRKIYKYSGFSEITSPTLEFYDVFNSSNQPISQEKMYKLFDSSGRILVLKPDMTTPIARITSTKLKESIYPIKMCYTSNIFRITEDLNGKMSEITQSGIEVIGSKNLKSDAEVIITAIRALLSLGIRNFKIELGQADFFKGLIENIEFDDEEMEKLKRLIENKNYVTLGNFLEDKRCEIGEENINILKKLPQLFGDVEIIDKARQLTKNDKSLKALDNVYKIYRIIDEIGLSSYISIDLGMIQNIDYYTGIIFKAYVDEVGEYILSGGRYDNLIKEFGLDLPATGFAVNVDNIMMTLKRQKIFKPKKEKRVLVYCKENYLKKAYELVNKIQDMKVVCEISLFDDEEKSLQYGVKSNMDEMITFISEEEIRLYKLKDREVKNINLKDFKIEFNWKRGQGGIEED